MKDGFYEKGDEVFSLSHTAMGIKAMGIGTGRLISAEYKFGAISESALVKLPLTPEVFV
jgi:hypothetical protein